MNLSLFALRTISQIRIERAVVRRPLAPVVRVSVVCALTLLFYPTQNSFADMTFDPVAWLHIPNPRVVDGDTLAAAEVTIRLRGIDCPERFSDAGRRATAALKSLINGPVVCALDGSLGAGRPAAICRTDEIPDLAVPLVEGGYCLDCTAYSGGMYLRFEPARVPTFEPAPYCGRPVE